jgi:uncharacterized membrane protein
MPVTLQASSDHRDLRWYGAIMLVAASTLAVWNFIDRTYLHLPWSYTYNYLCLLITIPVFFGGLLAIKARLLPFVLSSPLLLVIIVYDDFTRSHSCFCPYMTWVGPLMIPLIIGAEIMFLLSRTDFYPIGKVQR